MKLKHRFNRFLHNEQLKHRLYVIIFESDTPAGKRFDVALIVCILLSIGLVILESLKGLPSFLTIPFIGLEFLFTIFFTFEYLTRIYCSPHPRKYSLISAKAIPSLHPTIISRVRRWIKYAVPTCCIWWRWRRMI